MKARISILGCILVFGLATLSLRAYPQEPSETDPLLRLDPTHFGAGDIVAALEQLERYRPPQAYDLVVQLLSHSDPMVARTAAWLLRRMALDASKIDAAVGALAAVFTNASSTDAQRVSAAIALGELRTESSAAPLSAALLKDPAAEVRAAAAQALGALHREGSASDLSAALSSDGDARVRQAAAEALGSVRDPPLSLSALIGALDDADAFVRLQAAYAIGRQRLSGAIGNLSQVLQDDADCRVRSAAAWALSKINDSSVCNALNAAAQGSCRSTKQAAAWARNAMGCQ